MVHKCPAGLQGLNRYVAVVLAVAIYKATLMWNIKNRMYKARTLSFCGINHQNWALLETSRLVFFLFFSNKQPLTLVAM